MADESNLTVDQAVATQGAVAQIQKRGFASFLFLGLLTGGIYSIYRIYVLARDVNIMCAGDGKKTSGALVLMLLTLLTAGIYGEVWLYMLANRLQENGRRYNLNFSESGGTVLLWSLLGVLILVGPFIAWHILFKNANAIADEFNKTLVPVTN